MKPKSIFNISIQLVLICFSIKISAQEMKITEFRNDPGDISARENAIYDANGDPCSLIKARCGLGNINFESDLGIQRIIKKEGEYWIWVPSGTTRLTVSLNDSLSYDFDLPQLTEGYKVYIVVISVILPAKVEYQNIPKLSFASKPSEAKVYLNEVYYGNTPISVNYNIDTLRIKVEKKTYKTIYEEAISITQNQEFNFDLKKDPFTSRFFMSLTIDPFNHEVLNPGISFGTLSKIGFYFLIRPGLTKPNFADIEKDYEISDTSDFYQNSFIDSKIILKKFELFGGITIRISENVFMAFGWGVLRYKKYQKLTYKNTKKKYLIAELKWDYPSSPFGAVDIHLFFRLWNKLLINLQNTYSYKHEYGDEYNILIGNGYYSTERRWLYADIKFGIGYSF